MRMRRRGYWGIVFSCQLSVVSGGGSLEGGSCLKQDFRDFGDLQDGGTGDHEWFPYYEQEDSV